MMNLKNTLITAGAMYVLGRLTANLTRDDFVQAGDRLRHLNRDEMQRWALGATDDTLGRMGLMRASQAPSSSSWAISGLGIGLLTGAGLALLFAPQAGEETRKFIGETVKERVGSNGERVSAQS